MQTVTCFQCTQETRIAPNAYLCSHCGEDLQHLLLPETVAEYFQARAHQSSERGELGAALAEAEHGLTYADSSELHLLAAILSKQLGRHDRMRHHVAAIPVDDSLRSEAEWLLRSHQDRERALQEAARHAQTSLPLPERSDPADAFLEELLGGQEADAATTLTTGKRTPGQMLASVALIVVAVLMVAASWWWIGPGQLAGKVVVVSQSSPTITPTRLVAGVVQSGVASNALPTLTVEAVQLLPTVVLLPTATPSPGIPANLVQVASQTPELADANPSHVILVESSIFDIRKYLRDKGFAALAELAIDARLQEKTLVLQGFVHLDAQRRELIEIARAIPGIEDVTAVNLLLRPLPTYIVQDGDTLWSIVFNLYGNVDRLDEFAAYNRDVLPSPDALAPGIELKVLPIQ